MKLDNLVNTKEAAKILKCSVYHVLRLIKQNKLLYAHKFENGCYLFDVNYLERYERSKILNRKLPLTNQQITEICTRLNNNEPISQLAIEYKVGTPVIYNHWKNHLKNKI